MNTFALQQAEKTQMTDAQIAYLQSLLETELRAARLPEELTAQVLEAQGKAIIAAAVADLYKRVEAQSNMIVRHVRVDRTRPSQAAIDATGRTQYVNRAVVDAMPIGEGEEVDVYTFKPGPEAYDKNGLISCAEVERQFDLRGLKPDPRAVAAMNEADPSFADDRPHGTQWKDSDGNYCYESFRRWIGERFVNVVRDEDGWGDVWSFSGVRK